MPLDPNILFQGAALRQANDARTQATIGNFFDKLQAQKIAEQDPEKMLRKAVARQIQGQGTPEDEALIKFESVLKGGETKYMPDEDGNVRAVTQPTLYDRLYQTGGQAPYQPQYPAMGDMSMPTMDSVDVSVPNAPAPMNRPLTTADLSSDAFAGAEKGVDFNRIANARANNAARVNLPAGVSPSNTYVANTPKGRQEAFKTDEAIRQKTVEADINASEAGAKKRSEMTQEQEVNTEQRKKALGEIQTNLQSLLADAKGTPSGDIEGFAATVSNRLGVPNEQAIKRARFESGKAISGLQSRISFLKGQGAITEDEAKQAMAFIPDPNDAYEIKIAKLQGGIDYINDVIGGVSAPTSTNKPGFKYLGRE